MIPDRFEPVLDGIRPLAEAFADAGHRLYLVGGVVRDLFLTGPSGEAITPTDLDFTTDAEPDAIEALIKKLDGVEAVWTQGKRFGTIGCRIDGVDHEITTHRAEAYSPDSRKPEVVFATEIDADLSRRDFTVNAMALSLPDATLVDPFDGMTDLLVHKVLRTPLSPEESFGDDPLRMLRAARFLNRYELTPEPELLTAVEQMAERLSIVSAERIRDELCRLIVLPDCSAGLWFLCDTGLAQQFFPELPEMRVEQDPIHRHKDVLAHTIAVVNNTSPELVLRLSALFHDVGKPATRAFGDNGVSFHHHEVVGARMTRKRMKALKFSNEMIDDVSKLVFLHLRFHGYGEDAWSDAAVRRYVRDAGDLLPRLNELTRCDCTTRNKRKADMLSRRMDRLEERIERLREQEELDSIRPDVDGARVMELLGIEPSRTVGEAMNFLLEARMEEGPLGTEEAERRLLAWWAERNA
ncbi:CCA tRNA nucleotidyltransferase [Actinospongicola halichondriae]|uniref:CCA tRNA nucleotidyltransferase n=1 Tax=Actinospongicola halichondriae TaxID=3236844 RepID=UPI003D4BC27B